MLSDLDVSSLYLCLTNAWDEMLSRYTEIGSRMYICTTVRNIDAIIAMYEFRVIELAHYLSTHFRV